MDAMMNRQGAPEFTLETSPTTAALDEALAHAQGEIANATKDKVNPAFRSKYADLASVFDACRPALAKHGICVTQWPLSSSDNRLHIVTRVAHKGEYMQARFAIPVDKANAHGVGSATTYARRFTLSAALGIAPDDGSDDDGNAASKKTANADPDVERLAPKDAPRDPETGELLSNYKVKAALAAKAWADTAIATLDMALTTEHVDQWREDNARALDRLEKAHIEQFKRVDRKAEEVRESLKARAA